MWPALHKVNALYRSFMDVDQVVTMTDLASRRRLKYMMDQIFGDDPCRIFHSDYMTNARVPEVNSASDSIMIIADLKLPQNIAYKDVIFKITFKSLSVRNQYEIEGLVYEILGQYELPFVMQHFKTYKCINFYAVLNHNASLIHQVKQRGATLYEHQSKLYDFNEAQIIVSERGGGSSLIDKIQAILTNKDVNISKEDWIAIFMQVMFCLAYFEEIGIMHHDLHLGNVWLDRTDQRVKYTLKITKMSNPIVFTTNYIVKIYDFDHAAITETRYRQGGKENTLLRDHCTSLGECNIMKAGRDYAQFCWWLHSTAFELLPEMVKATIKNSVNQSFLENEIGDQLGSLSWSGHPCKVAGHSGTPCESYETNSVVSMISRISETETLKDNGSTNHVTESVLSLLSYDH